MTSSSYWDVFKRYVQTLDEEGIEAVFRDNPVLRDAAKLVKQNPDISLRKVAEQLGVAKSSLSRMVKDWVMERGLVGPSAPPLPGAGAPPEPTVPESNVVQAVDALVHVEGGGSRSRGSSRVSTQFVKTAQDVKRLLERSIKDDIEHVLNTYSLPIEPKLPILMKEVRDAAWWMHVTHDLGVIAFTMLAPLAGDQIDLRDPAKTVKAMAGVLKGLIDVVEKREKDVEALRAEVERLQRELEAAKRLAEEYKAAYREALRALDELKKHIVDLKERIGKTMHYLLHVAPSALSPEERAKFLSVALPAVREVWGEAR